ALPIYVCLVHGGGCLVVFAKLRSRVVQPAATRILTTSGTLPRDPSNLSIENISIIQQIIRKQYAEQCMQDPVAAVISVVETCKRTGINSRTCLAEALPILASANPGERHSAAATLTPSRWLPARPASPA